MGGGRRPVDYGRSQEMRAVSPLAWPQRPPWCRRRKWMIRLSGTRRWSAVVAWVGAATMPGVEAFRLRETALRRGSPSGCHIRVIEPPTLRRGRPGSADGSARIGLPQKSRLVYGAVSSPSLGAGLDRCSSSDLEPSSASSAFAPAAGAEARVPGWHGPHPSSRPRVEVPASTSSARCRPPPPPVNSRTRLPRIQLTKIVDYI